jgi:hypothetical protein
MPMQKHGEEGVRATQRKNKERREPPHLSYRYLGRKNEVAKTITERGYMATTFERPDQRRLLTVDNKHYKPSI